MTKTTRQSAAQTAIGEDTELGFGAMLIAESEKGVYEPVGIVSTIGEARQIADEDYGIRVIDTEKGLDRMCPARYVVWMRGDWGAYRTVSTFEAH